MITLQLTLVLYIVLSFFIMLVLILLPTYIGFMMPPSFTLKKSRNINASKEVVFFLLTNYKKFPRWRKRLSFVDVKVDSKNRTKVIEYYEHSKKKEEYTVVNYIENHILSLVHKNKDYISLWSFELKDYNENQTNLTIKETIYVYNSYLRFMIRFIFKSNSDKTKVLNRITGILEKRKKYNVEI